MIEEIFKLISTHPRGLLIFIPQEGKEEATEPIFLSSSAGQFICKTFFELEKNQKDALRKMIQHFKIQYGLKTVPQEDLTSTVKTLMVAFSGPENTKKTTEVYNITDFKPKKRSDRKAS